MNTHITSITLLTSLIVAIIVGRGIRRHLPDEHLSADSKDTVKLAMGLVATMTALLLGLLVSSAKGTYDTQRTEVILMASKVAFLDRVLTTYGPEASAARDDFRAGVADAYQRMWPDESGQKATLAPDTRVGDRIYTAIQALQPQDDVHRGWKSQAATLAADIAQIRVLLMAQSVPSIPRPLMVMVGCWLLIIFLGFSVLAPPNTTTLLALVAAAISVAGAVFLVMELDQPFGGVIRISGEPMQRALSQFAK